MNTAFFGFLVVIVPLHLLLIAIPIKDTLRSAISLKSKLVWIGFLVLLPLIGVLIFHYKYKTGLFQGRVYEVNAAEERARSGTLAPDDDE